MSKKIICNDIIWKEKAILISTEYKEDLIITIPYVNELGVRVFPYDFYISYKELIKCPIRKIKNKYYFIVKIKKLKINQ